MIISTSSHKKSWTESNGAVQWDVLGEFEIAKDETLNIHVRKQTIRNYYQMIWDDKPTQTDGFEMTFSSGFRMTSLFDLGFVLFGRLA